MVVAKFIISNKHDVQKVGLRLIAISAMMEMGFKNGIARNLEKGKVEILVDGQREQIETLAQKTMERLETRLEDLGHKEEMETVKNPTISEIDYNVDETVPDIMASSQWLMLDQMSESVVYLKKLQKLDTMPADIAKELGKVLKK